MASGAAPKVPVQEITSVDIPNFVQGLFQNGAQNAPIDSFIQGKDVELSIDGYITQRRTLQAFLPDTIEAGYQKFLVYYNGVDYYFTLDNGKAVWAREGDSSWTVCTGTNTVTTQNGGRPILIRAQNSVLILNGGNGDKLAYIDLATAGFPVVKYTLVTDPSTAPTAALTVLTAGPFNIYYAYTYTGPVGTTILSPILTQSINTVRDQWTATAGQKITITRPGTPPAGAAFWNLFIAVAPTSGTIQPTDLLAMATKIPLNQTTFVDDGTLAINLGSPAPTANSTDGPRVQYGIVEEGNPILYGDIDHPYDIHIGGGQIHALDFSIANGGFTAQPEQGTNFFPTSVVGFRNGQGTPSLTVLFSNTEGLSKQSVLQQQTVTYGNQSFSVWGLTEQHYGSAGVAAPHSPINYNGKLAFLSTDGFVTLDTQTNRLNVISSTNISELPLGDYVRSIKTSAAPSVIGAGWNDKYMWLVPANGFNVPQQILVYDTSNQKTAWYTMDILAQWIGVVTPQNSAGFVYICQGKSTYKLLLGSSTFDVKGGLNIPFSTGATGPLIGMGGKVHNVWQADVQAVFYILGLVGDMTIGVNYRNESGNLKTKTKVIHGPSFTPSAAGGWGDPGWTYSKFPAPSYRGTPIISLKNAPIVSKDIRARIQLDDVFNEAQWFFYTPVAFNSFKLRAISYEGINLGVRPDLQ
jgi:hypothetical protein